MNTIPILPSYILRPADLRAALCLPVTADSDAPLGMKLAGRTIVHVSHEHQPGKVGVYLEIAPGILPLDICRVTGKAASICICDDCA